jgi:proline dehydrogenase
LCKGIYVEPRVVAYKDPSIINDNFKYSLEKLLGAGCYVGIATHDEKLIWHALSQIDKLNLKREDYEFQMLLGVTEELIILLCHSVRIFAVACDICTDNCKDPCGMTNRNKTIL